MATDEANFSQAMRGYNREEVDKAIVDLRRDLIKANTERAEASKEIKRLSARIAELDAELDEVGSPTYSGLGHKLENTLRVTRALGLLDKLASAVDPYDTDVGRLRSEEALPERVRQSVRSTGG